MKELRDLDLSDLNKLRPLPEVLRKRAHHVITENARVLEAVDALENHDFNRLGELFSLSHKSMRDDYEVSVPEIDLLVQLADNHNKVFGSRLTGGGFGGSIVALCHPGHAAEVGLAIQAEYQQRSRFSAQVLVPGVPRPSPRQSHQDLRL